jgi:EXLDI family protein
MQKQIYIKDADLQIFERAEALAGTNLSATIVEALRRFIEVEEAKADGMEEQEIEVGVSSSRSSNDTKKVKFIGKKIASARVLCGQTSSQDDRGTDYTLYLTKKGKFLLHREYWTRWQDEDGEASYNIYDSLTELSDSVPGSLVQKAGEALGLDTAEYLDV